MNKSRKRVRAPLAATAALAAMLLGTTALPAMSFAADGAAAAQAAAVLPALGRVDLTASLYAEIKQVNLLSDQNGKIVTFTLSMTNKGSADISFVDYWVRLVTKSGAQFTVKLLPQDKDKNTVPAGSTQDFSFYASINDATSLGDLTFRIIKWDFSLENFERTMGEIAVPDGFTNVTPAGGSQVAKLGGTDVQMYVSKFTLGKNEKYSLPNITLKLENVDSHSLTVPEYQFAVRTGEGYTYPLEVKGLKDLVITPQETKELTLTGSVPVAVSTDDWQLVLTQNLADLKLNVPIAFFALPAVTTQDGTEAGKEVQFEDENGLYTAKLNGIYRLPWEDQDIISADMVLANNGTDSLPVPNMLGYFLLDDNVKVPAQVIMPAKVIGLNNGSSIGMQMAAKVPYTYEFSKVKLVLQEKTEDDKTNDVLEFETPADMMNVPIADSAASYDLTDPGYRSEFTIQGVKTYEGKSTYLYTAQVLVENKEKRFTNLAKLVASFRSPDGTVYPASIVEVKDKVVPGGKALLNVYSELPVGVSSSGMNLLLGEAVSGGKLSGSDSSAGSAGGSGSGGSSSGSGSPSTGEDMYVKPFAFWLPQDKNEVQTTLKDVSLAPYTLSIDHVGTALDNNQLTLKFNYEIVKDSGVLTSTDNRKIVFQLNDTNGLRAIEWSADLSSFEPKSSDTPGTPQSSLRVGKYNDFKIDLQNSDLIYKLSFLKTYDFNIYEEFQGHRRLIASMKNDWFVRSTD